MATFKFTGIDEYLRQLEAISDNTEEYIGKAIYKGANVVANAMKQAIYEIPVDERKHPIERSGIMRIQKKGLYEGFGIAPIELKNGFWNVKLGFDGYNDIGQPNAMIARTVESGTSFMPKFQTISKAISKTRKNCEQIMKDSIDQDIYAITKDMK